MHDKSIQEEYAGAAIQVNPGIQIIQLSSTKAIIFYLTDCQGMLSDNFKCNVYSPARKTAALISPVIVLETLFVRQSLPLPKNFFISSGSTNFGYCDLSD